MFSKLPEILSPFILSEVIRLAKQYPNARYKPLKGMQNNGCMYDAGSVENGPLTEGCIVGQAIRRLFPSHFKAIAGVQCGVCNLIFGQDESTSHALLSKIQQFQDTGYTWGEAIRNVGIE